MSFETRYKQLNDAQKRAVDAIDGPLMVIAGPGTGKTELLSMRTANILSKTDTLPQSILCLTFTESGALAMRERLANIIGTDSYKVAIHTFHSFGSEIINRNGDYFYDNAHFQPASELDIYEIARSVFDELDHTNPLASKLNGEYTQLRDALQAISELKKSGLTSDELLKVLDANEMVLDATEKQLASLFSSRVSKATLQGIPAIISLIEALPAAPLPPQITSLQSVLSLSLTHALEAADSDASTKPITSWKNTWLEKNEKAEFVFKDRRRMKKLRALSYIYYQYLVRMQEKELYDFDDMVLKVVHALEIFPDLRYTLQEQYLYIMVDEFQDTNVAQARLLQSLAMNDLADTEPNIMVVGDDDQAIYRFQGAELSNILRFNQDYQAPYVVLKDNYRSTNDILENARSIITQAVERLENHVPELNKALTPHYHRDASMVSMHEFTHSSDERRWTASDVAAKIKSGVPAGDITVIARRHSELIELLPYLTAEGVQVSYERRSNVLESEVVVQLSLLAQIIVAMAHSQFEAANSLLPELLSHPAWKVDASELWKLSTQAYESRTDWLTQMSNHQSLSRVHSWLVELAEQSHHLALEPIIDRMLGYATDEGADFTSPYFEYFFSDSKRTNDPDRYIELLENLRTIRVGIREYTPSESLLLTDFLDYVSLHKKLGTSLISVRAASKGSKKCINLMTAHKAKGLEFEHVYIVNAVDNAWGENVRTPPRSIHYPENLKLESVGSDYDERIRLFYVAMTRAKSNLSITYSMLSDSDKRTLPASFISGDNWNLIKHDDSSLTSLEDVRKAWHHPLVELPSQDMKTLLGGALENYKLSATHLNTFLDVTHGGPQTFLLRSLLHFPEAMSPSAAYGSAIHAVLQRTHTHLRRFKKRRPIEDILQDFETSLEYQRLSAHDTKQLLHRGTDYLQRFFDQTYDSFSIDQQAELNFSNQQSTLGKARLTGSLDVIEIDEAQQSVIITDYKTGNPSLSWKGKTDAEKVKLHKYRQQLMFYMLLVGHSRDYAKYEVTRASIQFVEPTENNAFVRLDVDVTDDELERFSTLTQIVYQRIVALDLPDIQAHPPSYKGVLEFEAALLED